MMIAPNRTPIQATLVEKSVGDGKCNLKVVLIHILEKGKLPAFLYTGRLLDADYHQLEIMNEIEVGQLIEGQIEVAGNPIQQSFILYDVRPASSFEEE